MKPQSFEESLIWYLLVGTYILYALALIYPANSILGWVLFLYLCRRLWMQTEATPVEERIAIPWLTWLWIVSMLVMAVATFVGCIDFGLETVETVKALMRWCTEWALIAIFISIGALKIRPQLIYRAVCIVCLQSLILIPVGYAAYLLHLPELIYTSPVNKLTPGSSVYYNIFFYSIESGTTQVRLFLFAPWGPALGVTSIIYFTLALQETDKKWRLLGVIGAVAMCIVSLSRQAIISLPLLIVLIWALTNFKRPTTQMLAGISCFLAGIFGTVIIAAIQDFWDAFTAFRPGSSKFHDILGRIALRRWDEAPIWGHGVQEVGPQVIAGHPIGSNHTWFGLLFVKGIVGFLAFLVPLLCSFIDLLLKAQSSATAKAALSVLITMFLFSFNDNQEVLFYLYWPGLVIMGIALKENVQSSIPQVEAEERYI